MMLCADETAVNMELLVEAACVDAMFCVDVTCLEVMLCLFNSSWNDIIC